MIVNRLSLLLCCAASIILAGGALCLGQANQVTTPILISEALSTRAIAFDAADFTREPFPARSQSFLYGSDKRTRIAVFVRNLILQPGDTVSLITADAEDGAHRHYNLTVEYMASLPGQEWASQLILRLSDNLGDVGDVLVGITYRGLASNRVRIGIGHVGGGPPDDEPFRVLDYDGSVQNVDYGPFFAEDTNLGKFFWEFWAMPGVNAYSSYMLSDGYGGAHALLFGFFAASDPNRYSLYGNIYTGSSITAFNSDDGPAPGEWAHMAVAWDGSHIMTYYDGVPVGRTAFAGPRRTPGAASGGGRLYIGGSDHNNLIGRIAQVRGYEGISTIEGVLGIQHATSAYAPETFFGLRGNGGVAATFLTNFFHAARNTPDLAGGRSGVLRGGTDIFFQSPPPPLSKFIVDPTAPSAPNFGSANVLVDQPRPAPTAARIFDSFSRRSSTLAFNGIGGLGSTESGSNGVQGWRSGGPDESHNGRTIFGILNGRAVILSGGPGIAWVPVAGPPGNLEVRVDRHPGEAGSGVQTGLCFRVRDPSNFFFASTGDRDPFDGNTLNFGYFLNGQKITLASDVPLPQGWTTLRVLLLDNGQINIYVDEQGVYSIQTDVMSGERGVGLYNDRDGLALTNRWDNFTVLDLP